MDLYTRYLFRQATGVFLLILLSLTSIVWIATALKRLTLVTSQGQSGWTFFKLTFLALPNLMAIIAPIALLITTIHTLNRANSDSELIVMTASGATVWRIAKPFVVLAIALSAMLAVANHLILPWSVRTLGSYVTEIRTDLISQVLRPGEFTSPENRLTFHIRDRSRKGDILGLIMNDERDPEMSSAYLAERGEIVKQGGSSYLVMHDGHIIRRPKDAKGARIIAFRRYVVDLSQFGANQGEHLTLKPRARYLDELLHPDPDDPRFKGQPGKFRSELHERFANPLYPIVFVLIAIAVLGQAQTNRQSHGRRIAFAFSWASGARLLGLAATNLAALKPWAVALIYGLPVSTIIVALTVAWFRMVPRKRSRFATGLANRQADLLERAKRLFSGGKNINRQETAS